MLYTNNSYYILFFCCGFILHTCFAMEIDFSDWEISKPENKQSKGLTYVAKSDGSKITVTKHQWAGVAVQYYYDGLYVTTDPFTKATTLQRITSNEAKLYFEAIEKKLSSPKAQPKKQKSQ